MSSGTDLWGLQMQLLTAPSSISRCTSVGTAQALQQTAPHPLLNRWTERSFSKRFSVYGQCSCFQGNIRRSYSKCLALFSLLAEYTVIDQHKPCCPWFNLNNVTRISRFNVEVSTLQRFASRRILFALSLLTSAGGMSLSPSIQCVRVVEGHRSPAFRLVNIMYRSQRCLDTGLAAKVSEYAFLKLKGIFREGRASLLDVDSFGKNIMDFL